MISRIGLPMFPAVNRAVAIVTPKQPFLDWLHNADPTSGTLTLKEVGEPAAYLIPDVGDDESGSACIQRYCGQIFEEQLDSWLRDTDTWPRNRDFKTFCRWFEYQVHSMVLDLCEGPLRRE